MFAVTFATTFALTCATTFGVTLATTFAVTFASTFAATFAAALEDRNRNHYTWTLAFAQVTAVAIKAN